MIQCWKMVDNFCKVNMNIVYKLSNSNNLLDICLKKELSLLNFCRVFEETLSSGGGSQGKRPPNLKTRGLGRSLDDASHMKVVC